MPNLSAYQIPQREAFAYLLIAVCMALLAGWLADRLHRRAGAWALLAFSVTIGVLGAAALWPAPEAALQIIVSGIFALSCSAVARRKGRDATLWATGGFMLTIVALIVVAVLPRRSHPPTSGSARPTERT